MQTYPVRVIEVGPETLPLTVREWESADEDGTLETLIVERKYLVRYQDEIGNEVKIP